MDAEEIALLPGGMSHDDALTGDDPILRVAARAASSAMYPAITDWFNAEKDRAEVDPDHLLIGMALFMIQMHASFAAFLVGGEFAVTVLSQFKSVVDRSYLEHFVDTAKFLDEAPDV